MAECWFCGSQRDIQMHHIYGGIAYRKKSTKYGLVVPLCMACHTGSDGVHSNHQRSLILKRWAQERFEQEHTREEFRAIFGKSYL